MGKEYKLSSEMVEKIQKILEKGDRVELMPKKDGIKILAVHRDEIK